MLTDQATHALQAIADPTRRAVLDALRNGPRAVGEIASVLPVSRPAVSQHLRRLKLAGLVEDTPVGTRRLYAIRREGLEPLRAYIESFWGDILGAFQQFIDEEESR